MRRIAQEDDVLARGPYQLPLSDALPEQSAGV